MTNTFNYQPASDTRAGNGLVAAASHAAIGWNCDGDMVQEGDVISADFGDSLR
jgi:hypothetical protein